MSIKIIPPSICPVMALFAQPGQALLGTKASPEITAARAALAEDWAVRVHLPAYLDVVRMPVDAMALRALPATGDRQRLRLLADILASLGKHDSNVRDKQGYDALGEAAQQATKVSGCMGSDPAAIFADAICRALVSRHVATMSVAEYERKIWPVAVKMHDSARALVERMRALQGGA